MTAAQKGGGPLARLRGGGKAALARALTDLDRRPEADETIALLSAAFEAALSDAAPLALGLTGPPGVGKSTLINAMIGAERAAGRGVGVVAVDPSSRRSGGAVLGDRARLSVDPEDDGVFVRSLAARDRLGGLAEIAYPAALLMRAVFDLVIIETVGVGQSETEIAGVADVVALCVQPSSGDALQFMKAGVAETPDVVVVTKADLGAPARRAAADARAALGLSGRTAPPVLMVSATAAASETGVEAVLAAARAVERGAPAERAARTRSQGAAWLAASLGAEIGRLGVAAFAAQAEPGAPSLRALSPFAQRRAAVAWARRALSRGDMREGATLP